jgi:hypothetical protein
MTVILLAITHLICGEYQNMGHHIKALRHIVKVKEGYSNLGWDGFLGLRVRK